MTDENIDPRQRAVLESAWQAFAAYGFRKTSMDDIARGAGMSRPALYQHYRNKEDIFRRLVLHHYDQAQARVAAELAQDGSVSEVLTQAMHKQGEGVANFLSSAHGMELLDVGSSTASDIVREGEGRLQALYAAWLEREVIRGRVGLPAPAQEVAVTLTSALKGIKNQAPDYASYVARVTLLGNLLGAGLAFR